jgi:hypothetical protein
MSTYTTKNYVMSFLSCIIHGVTFRLMGGELLSNFWWLKFTLYCGLFSDLDIHVVVLMLFTFLSSLMSLLSQLEL